MQTPIQSSKFNGWQDFRVILSLIAFAIESLSGCLSTVQAGDLGKTEVVGGVVRRRPNCIGGRRTHTPLPHGAFEDRCFFAYFGHLNTSTFDYKIMRNF